MKITLEDNLRAGGVKERLRLGEGATIDERVTLAYPPSRGRRRILTIGPNAHIRMGSIVYGGSRIGANLETGHNVIIREQNDLGDNLRIWSNSVIDYGCRIGNNVRIHNQVYIGQFTVIEDDVFLAPGVTLANDIHPGCPKAIECMKGPYIKKGAQIGINSSILPRVTIGRYSLIGSGSVVTSDIPDGFVAYGNPAKVICRIGQLKCSTGLLERPYSHLEEVIENADSIG